MEPARFLAIFVAVFVSMFFLIFAALDQSEKRAKHGISVSLSIG
jgi:hypothetical protein